MANLAAALGEDRHPRQIGPYQILEIIGEGGMGTVYKAQQSAPIQRTVALKVIKYGMDSRAVLSRFESERRALAMMDHPNVARVLDAGTTESGRPYFVMEYVDGEPITTFADHNRLSVVDRLRLLAQACHALQHAHQKAILHRDIKPTNILVTRHNETPLVKVIDFGVAKATERTWAQQTLFTEAGQLIGTPEYMSPEQADGSRDIDTRSDVYSLGVVLFELLSGALPFDSKTLRAAGYAEVCRIIREVDPPRPSAKLSSLGAAATTVAEQRQLVPAALVQKLRSELDWIVIKSLSKEREMRYASPSELALDIENYLQNRPLRAGPESIFYRTRKFVRRNRIGVLGAVTALALLIGGITATSWQAFRATRAERAIRDEQQRTLAEKQKAIDAQKQAEAARQATESINGFLSDMLGSVDPDIAQGREVRVRDVLDEAAEEIDTRFPDQPTIAAALHATLGQTYASLGLLEKADHHLGAAHSIELTLHGEQSVEAMESLQRIAMLRAMQDRLQEAFDLHARILERYQRLLGPDDPMTIQATVELGVVSEQVGQIAEAEKLFRTALAADERIGVGQTANHFVTMGNLGQMLRQLGRLDEAGELCLTAYQGMAKLKGENHPITLGMQGVYADVLRLKGELSEAERLMRDYLDRALMVFGSDHLNSIHPEQGLAVVLEVQGRRDEALTHFRNALARSRKVLGSAHRETLIMEMTFAAVRANAGAYEEATSLFLEAYDGWQKSAGPDNPNTVITLYGLVQNYYPQKKWAEALEPARQLYELLVDPDRVQITPARRARYLSAYGIVLSHLHRFDEADAPLRVAYEALIRQDINNKGNIEAYHSVVNLLEGAARLEGRSEDEAFWKNEAVRYGPVPEYTGTMEWPTTGPSTLPALDR